MKRDPFDIEWITVDPLEREVVMLRSRAEAREAIGKHEGDEFLSTDEVRDLIEDPQRIDLTQRDPHREIYYSDKEDKPRPYARAVVEFDEGLGTAISWSRYEDHVSLLDIVYERQEKSDGDI